MKSIHSRFHAVSIFCPNIAVKNAVEGPVMLVRSQKQISPQALVHARAWHQQRTPHTHALSYHMFDNTVDPVYRGHHWDQAGCPVYSGTSL